MASSDVVICAMQFLVSEFDVYVIEDSGLQLVNWYGQNRPLVKFKKASNAQIETWVCPEQTKCAGNVLASWLRCWERDRVGFGFGTCEYTKQTSPLSGRRL